MTATGHHARTRQGHQWRNWNKLAPFIAATLATVLVGLTACANGTSGGGGKAFDHAITWVVASEAGGGFDSVARGIQPFLQAELKVPVVVQNKPGGGFAIGSTDVFNTGNDCYKILLNGIPFLPLSYLAQNGIHYTDNDFATIAGLTHEPSEIRVSKSARWKTINDFIAYAKAHPGQLKGSVSGLTSEGYLALRQLERAAGVKFNIVPYAGGQTGRLAVINGDVDFTQTEVFSSLSIANKTRVLAVQTPTNDWPRDTDNAPTLNKALHIHLPGAFSSYGAFTSAKCKSDHPERFQALAKAFQAVGKNPKYIAKMKKTGDYGRIDFRTGDKFQVEMNKAASDIRTLLREDPNLFKAS